MEFAPVVRAISHSGTSGGRICFARNGTPSVKKNDLKPWQNKQWVIPPKSNAEFVCAMEDVLDLYHEPYDPLRPVVCFDEGTKQLIGETRSPIPMQPGEPQRYDYEYERHGTCNLFMFCEPLAAWRHVEVTDRRTMVEYAHCMKYLTDVRYPDVEMIRVVQDNLSTHKPAALYKAFPPEEARRILQRLEFHYTPKRVCFKRVKREKGRSQKGVRS